MSSDMILRCAECEVDFLWTPAEQATGDRPVLCPACQHIAPAPGRKRGLVKWFSRGKGYGFITPVGGDDLFVHKSGLATGQPMLRAGQLVEFSLESTRRGVQATNVMALERRR
jgi:cold shock protein